MNPSFSLGSPEILLLAIILGLVVVAVWLWSLIHCITNRNLSDTNRIIGVVLIVVLGIVGSVVYLFLPRNQS